jgi:hypothetical protein
MMHKAKERTDMSQVNDEVFAAPTICAVASEW